MANSDDPIPQFSVILRSALGDRLDPEAKTFPDMLAKDGIMKFPFAPPGGVNHLEGRQAVREYMGGLLRMISIDEMAGLTVHPCEDPAIIVLEFSGKGQSLETGRPYRQHYVSIITLRDGRIARYRDYWNPLALASAEEASHD